MSMQVDSSSAVRGSRLRGLAGSWRRRPERSDFTWGWFKAGLGVPVISLEKKLIPLRLDLMVDVLMLFMLWQNEHKAQFPPGPSASAPRSPELIGNTIINESVSTGNVSAACQQRPSSGSPRHSAINR